MSEPLQVWVRNDKGQVYGPLTPPSIELLIDNNVIAGRMQISTDGVNYVFPGRVPGLRMIFPRDTWGDTVVPGEQLDAEWGQVVMPASIHGQGGTSGGAPGSAVPVAGPPGAPVAGPGIPRGPVAGPGIRNAPTAGPGARQQPPGRPMVPGQMGVSRPSQTGMPVVRSSPSVAEFMNSSSPSGVVRSSGSGVGAAPAAPVRSSPSVADLMNAGAPSAVRSSGSGVVAAPAAPVRASPSVADFMNAGSPSAVRPSVSGVVAAPAAPIRSSPSVADFTPRATSASSTGMRAAPPPPPVGDQHVPPSGSLSETSTQQLYYLAAISEVTGLLTVKLADRELVAHFKKGNPEFFDSTHTEDSLDTFLLAQKLATRVQLDQAQAQSGRFGGELLGALFGLGLLNPNAVFQHLGQRASQLLQRVLTAELGTFTFDHEELPSSRSMPMGNKWGVYLEALRRVPVSDVRRRLNKAIELPVMKGSGRLQVTDVRLTPQETRALNYFDGVRSLAQLMRDLPAEADTILRTAWMLSAVELVSFAQVAPRPSAGPPAPAPAPARAAAPPAPAAAPAPVAAAPKVSAPPVAAPPPKVPGPPVMTPQPARPAAAPGNPVQMPRPGTAYPGGPQQPTAQSPAQPAAPQRPPPPVMKPAPVVAAPVNFETETRQLQVIHDQMKKQNFFEVLGLKRDADAGAVKMAYLKAARSYHPDTVAPGSPDALAKLKADVFALISEANRTLSDAVLRKEYTAELDAGGTGSKVDIEKILRAEEVFQKGRILVQARKYADALKLFEEAVTCNGEEAEFYAWRGYAKFLGTKDKKSVTTEVLKDLNLCVSKNPNVAATYYFLGFVAKTNGDDKTALTNFKKCVSLDPKHIDAQREVRMMKK